MTTVTAIEATEVTSAPHWPALLQQQGVDELLYLENKQAWAQQLTAAYLLNPGDRLLDSTGTIWVLTFHHKQPQWHMSGTIQLHELQQLIQAHAVVDGNCCISKLQLSSIAEALQFVKSLR
ncbi:DUF4144 family protein [Shewanella dokdonensis]|uniref:Uncharacterized protein n=1 Tax=Shewanella dokdonensis TaxID=712036 RepID=A0ABX8DC79_9GAMM|nr:DUF4144 family protein [Shewanella dokdonensis]MCL1074651.1 DUF4144 domain-containing protein [Shewanella dokdonensis]QVK22354.1 hypothetical protein KHX94_13230 [Shewanella dokdonensis]